MGHRMGRQSAEMGRSRSPQGDRSGPSRQPQRSAGLETTGWSRGRPLNQWAAGEEKLVLLPDGQTYANSVARKLRAGADRLDRLGPAGSDWRRGRAGGRPPVDPRIDRQVSGSPASGGRRLQWGLVERAGSGRPSVKHSGCGARPDARAKEVAGSDRSMGEPGLRAGPHGATWLILPVVICLSQRLSHACLSINCFIL